MKFTPAFGGYLDRYEVEDGGLVLGIANEGGDITAYVRRSDGTSGHSYGGPVYEPPQFMNVCDRCQHEPRPMCCCGDGHAFDYSLMTKAECATATVFARKVGWMS